MLQNSRVTAFTVSELLRKNQQEGGGGVKGLKLPPNQIRDKIIPVRTSNKKCKPAESFENLSETCKFYVC